MITALRAGAALCALALSATPAMAGTKADGPKAIALSTKSEPARAAALEVVRRIESFQFGPDMQAAAKKAVEADADFAFGHYLVGITLPRAQAKEHLDKAVALSSKASDGERRYIAAAILNREDKTKEALAAFEALSRDYPGDRMVWMMLGQLHTAERQLPEARAAFEKALALDGSTPRAHALLGNVESLGGEYAKSRALYETALAKRAAGTVPGQVHFSLAMTHVYEGDVDAALASMQRFLGEYKGSPQSAQFPEVFIWNAMARINLESGRTEAALQAYEKGFESVPGSPIAEEQKSLWRGRLHHGKGRTLARMGRHQEAWAEAERVKKMIDEGGEAGKQYVPAWHYLAGYVKLEAGEHAAAIEHLKQADTEDPFIQFLLARAYEKAGDKENARKAYEEVVNSTQLGLDRALAYGEAKRRLASL